MATISTTFGFQDQITQGLQHLNSVLAQLSQTLSSMNNATQGAGDSLDKMGEQASKAADKSDDTLKKLFTFNQAKQVFDTVTGAIGNVIGQMGALNGMYQAQMDAEARLSAVMGARMSANADDVQDMVGYIDEFSKGSAYNKTMLTNAAQELGTYIDKADTLKGLLPMLTSMSQQAGIANEQGLMSMATMIGKVMGGDMGGLSKRGWQFTDEEKEAFKAMEEEERLNFLVKTAKENIGEQDKALAGMMANLANQRHLENLQMKLGGIFGGFLDSMGKAQIEIKVFIYETLIGGIEYVQNHLGQLKIVLAAVAAGVLAIAAAWLVLHAQQIKTLALSIKETAVKIAGFIATNAALLATVGIILLILAALAAVLIFSDKTFPFILGCLGAVKAVVWETGAVIKKAFQTSLEATVNFFLSAKDKIMGALLFIAEKALSILSPIVETMDSVLKTNFSKNIRVEQQFIESQKSKIAQNAEKKWTLGWTDDTEGYGNRINSEWETGQINGQLASRNFQQWLNGVKTKVTPSSSLTPSESNGLENMNNFSFGSNGALKTEDKGFVEISNDYRELLSKTATRRFNFAFKNVEPTVNVGGIVIQESADEGKIIQIITEAVTNVSSSSLDSESA